MPRTLPARVVLALAGAAGLWLRAAAVFGDEGIYWPDEIYQSFEPAHRLVFGYGLVAWEFIEGARSWALPGLVAGLLGLFKLFGADAPATYIHGTKLVFALMSLGAALGVYRLAVVHGAKELSAAVGAAAFALAAPVLYFAPRAMSENAAALPVVWGLALVLDREATRRRVLLGASLLGVAVLLRLQAGVFCAGALGVLAARKDWRRLRDVGLALAAWAFAYGALDAATWHAAPGAKAGGWFHSAVVYLRFNLVENRAAGWGTSPPGYYLKYLWSSMPGVTVALGVGLVLAARRAPGLLAVALAFFVLHSFVPHKELRFILPVLPLFCALLAVGLDGLKEDTARNLATTLVLGVAVASGWGHRSLTMGDLGAYLDRPASSAWDDFGHVNRLLLAASRQEDLCGLRVDVHPAWMGGSTYLHRNAPLYGPGYPPESGHFNYAIVGGAGGAQVVAQDKGLFLVKLPVQGCRPDPGYSWRLP